MILTKVSEPTYSAATVYSQDIYSGNISLEVSPSFRESQTAFIEDTPLVQCIKHRAASFQGVPVERLEGLQVVKYPINGYYNTHVDWIGDHCVDELCQKTGDRETSFFVYLQADCKGGATEFSEMALPGGVDEELWCKFLDCNDADGNRDGNKQASDGNGTGVGGEGERTLKFRPKAGNAIFWENLDGFGQGIWKVAHAGMPVIEGTKIGMNIWTRERAPGDYHGPIRHREKDVIVDFEEITVPVLEKSWEELGFDEVENIGMVEEKFGDSA
jgi:prolyl 4-hydroxylase